MADGDKNTVLMIVGVVLVLIIIAYVVYPVYFDKYVLMNIPAYKRLSEVLDASKESMDECKANIAKYKNELDKIEKLGGTEAEILAQGRKRDQLEKRIESYKTELKQFTGLVANLKDQLKKSTGDAEECSKLQAAATKRMKELNDLLISEFVLDDKDLARRLQATRDSLLGLLSTSKNIVCSYKGMALVMLKRSASTMRNRQEKTNTVCDRSSAEYSHVINNTKDSIRKSSYIQDDLVKVFEDVEGTISYVLQNKFCSKDLTFRVDEFEKFVSNFINGLCESDDWKKVTGKQLDYILNKPATYL
jgi:chromosome segregation ATPase